MMLALFLLASIAVSSNFESGSVGKIQTVSPTHLRCAVVGQSDREHRKRQADRYYFRLDNLPRARKLPARLMEQMMEYNSKLGRCPTVADRIEFGGGLVRAIVAAVQAGFANVHH